MPEWFRQNQVSGKTTRNIGADAESAAIKYLEERDLRLITRNYSCRRGEIDLIMIDGNFLVFVEVRYRKNDNFGTAAESVTRQKQQRLLTTASYYLQNEDCDADTACRFDVITLSGKVDTTIDWIKDAFQS